MRGVVEGEELLRGLRMLQANIKGHLVRKRFQSLKEEYESIVKEIEGSLDLLQWSTCSIPRPVFPPKFGQKTVKVKEPISVERGSRKNDMHISCPVELSPESEHDCEVVLPIQPPVKVMQSLYSPEDKPCGGAQPLSEESEEGQDCSNVSSVWDSAVLEVESPGRSQDLHFQRGRKMPQTMPDLQRYRRHLTMELLWLQQAIVSRKNYLSLKQRLGTE